MSLSFLDNNPPWDWPEDAKTTILNGLNDEVNINERLLAVRLAGDPCVMDDDIAQTLLEIVANKNIPEKIRSQAAISLGPTLELASDNGFEDEDTTPQISNRKFEKIKTELKKVFLDAAVPKEVRRRILEASIRSPELWHQQVVTDAYSNGDRDWRLTAVFAMRWTGGFDEQILQSLGNPDEDIRYEAICAAGNWGVKAAWPSVLKLATSLDTEKSFLMASIEAAFSIRPKDAGPLLGHLAEHEDEDIAELVLEGMAMANPELEEELNREEEEAEESLKKFLKEQENF